MAYYDSDLQVLKKRVERKLSLILRLEELKKKKKELEPKLKVLEIYAHNEQIDVDNLEGKTFASAFYDIIGKKEKKLEKERAEANEWILKRDNAKRDLDELNIEIERAESELVTLNNCEKEYSQALDDRLNLIKKSGGDSADHKFVLTEKMAYCDNQIKEINEAVSIVENALKTAENALHELDEAESWGEYDMIGRGKIADIKKYDHIDNAEMYLRDLKKELSKLKSEVADITLDLNIEVNLSEFSSTADWIFDNIFTASTVLDQIDSSKKSVKTAIEQIKDIRSKLVNFKDGIIVELAKLQVEYEALR